MNGALLGVISGSKPINTTITDPFWSDVVLLMPLDSSLTNNLGDYSGTINYNSTNPLLSSGQSKFGVNSALFSASTVPELRTSGGNIPELNGTIEAWVYPTSFGQNTIASKYNPSSGPAGFIFQTGPTGKLSFLTNGATGFNISTSASELSLNQWSHVVAVWELGSIRVYINGVLENDEPQVASYGANANTPISLGCAPNISPERIFEGYISEFRYTSAVRYTSSFTPPTAPFPRS